MSSSGVSPRGLTGSERAGTGVAASFVAFVLLVAIGVAGRLVPHPPNFTPVAAIALFAGFFFPYRSVAALAPLAAMVISDGLIGAYDVRIMLAVHIALAAPVLLGPAIARRPTALRVGLCAASSSLAFFVVSNFAVFLQGGMYEPTAAGLVRCYVAALPFLRFSLAGDLFFSLALFGGFALLVRGLGLRRIGTQVEHGAARAVGLLRVAAATPVKD